ncbi:MAG: hypothetical protein HY774_04590 [Acidobacteria bacterium]|nr:hypothetical protein [Acidobacteriota bacterium]
MVCRFGHTTGSSVRSGLRWFAPGWALEAGSGHVPCGVFGDSLTIVFQRPSGREPVMVTLSGGRVSKATLATGYFPPPIRANPNFLLASGQISSLFYGDLY